MGPRELKADFVCNGTEPQRRHKGEICFAPHSSRALTHKAEQGCPEQLPKYCAWRQSLQLEEWSEPATNPERANFPVPGSSTKKSVFLLCCARNLSGRIILVRGAAKV